jgi:hypothetical protein
MIILDRGHTLGYIISITDSHHICLPSRKQRRLAEGFQHQLGSVSSYMRILQGLLHLMTKQSVHSSFLEQGLQT